MLDRSCNQASTEEDHKLARLLTSMLQAVPGLASGHGFAVQKSAATKCSSSSKWVHMSAYQKSQCFTGGWFLVMAWQETGASAPLLMQADNKGTLRLTV